MIVGGLNGSLLLLMLPMIRLWKCFTVATCENQSQEVAVRIDGRRVKDGACFAFRPTQLREKPVVALNHSPHAWWWQNHPVSRFGSKSTRTWCTSWWRKTRPGVSLNEMTWFDDRTRPHKQMKDSIRNNRPKEKNTVSLTIHTQVIHLLKRLVDKHFLYLHHGGHCCSFCRCW